MFFYDKLKSFDYNICKLNFASFLRAFYLLSPIILLFYTENGLGVKELFLFQSVFYLTSIIMEVPAGYLSDLITKKVSLILSYTIFLIVILLLIFFKGYYVILFSEILLAISKVFLDNTQSGYLYDYLFSRNRENEMPDKYARLNFFLAAGTTFAAIVGTYFYSKFGSRMILHTELIIAVVCISLILMLPYIKNKIKLSFSRDITSPDCNNLQNTSFTEKNKNFSVIKLFEFFKEVIRKKYITYYILYSGLLTSFSIVFALSFQPLLLKVSAPILFFGIAAFSNHGIRALFSYLTCKALKFFNIKSMIFPLFFLYILAFICIFLILFIKNIYIVMSLIIIICLIIGFQLMFTIRHISRLHSFVTSENRGSLISINNLFSRSTTAIMLFSSKFFIDKFGFENYYFTLFVLFLIFGGFLMLKFCSLKEHN